MSLAECPEQTSEPDFATERIARSDAAFSEANAQIEAAAFELEVRDSKVVAKDGRAFGRRVDRWRRRGRCSA